MTRTWNCDCECEGLQRRPTHFEKGSSTTDSMSMQYSNIRKSHNWIVEREISSVIKVRAAVEIVMLSSLYKIFAGSSCSTPTNHSHELEA